MRGAHSELVNKTFRLRQDWVKKAEKRAIDEQRSLNSVVEEAIERYATASEGDAGAGLIANARARTAERRHHFGGRIPEDGPLTRGEVYER